MCCFHVKNEREESGESIFKIPWFGVENLPENIFLKKKPSVKVKIYILTDMVLFLFFHTKKTEITLVLKTENIRNL